MSKKMLLVLGLGLLTLIAAGCLPQPSLRSELFLEDTSLLGGEPCGAPCWNGITPGETSWSDAIAILQNDPQLAGYDENTEEGDLVQAVWQKAGSDQYCCRLLADSVDGTVNYLFLALASPGVIVDNVLSQYGDPTYVTTFDFTDAESVIQMIYPDVPMVVSVLVGDASASILANSEVVAVLYMAPDEMDFILQTTELSGWNGYQAYQTYVQSTPVITPVMTLTPAPEQ